MNSVIVSDVDVQGFPRAIKGMRNSWCSWPSSDSRYDGNKYVIGNNDMRLMHKLIKAGPSHCKFRRMIVAWMDILAPLYWWKQFDTYKVGTVSNSCSTMHSIMCSPFTAHDFVFDGDPGALDLSAFNDYRTAFLNEKDPKKKKRIWRSLIQVLPSGYKQLRTVCANYEVLAHMVHDRKGHKLDEWSEFIEYMEDFPYSELIFGVDVM